MGSHRLDWTYKKMNLAGVSDDLSAEIEYISIKGTKLMNDKCQKCERGIPNFDGDRCMLCLANEYYENGKCQKCNPAMYSPPGSVGASSCLYRPPCKKEDYTFSVTECIDDRRELVFKLKDP